MAISPLRKHARVSHSDFVGAKVFTVTSIDDGTGAGTFRAQRDAAKAHTGGRGGAKWAVIDFAVGGIFGSRAAGITDFLSLNDLHRILTFGASAPGAVLFYGCSVEIRYSTKLIVDNIGFAAGPLPSSTEQWDTLRIFGARAWNRTSGTMDTPNEDIWVDHCSGKWSQDELVSQIQCPQFRISNTNSLW